MRFLFGFLARHWFDEILYDSKNLFPQVRLKSEQGEEKLSIWTSFSEKN